MRLPVNALADYLKPLPAADEIARQLTSLGFEVEGRGESEDGVVLEVNVTPNRGDAFSVRGLARELCAAREIPFKEIFSPELPADKADSSLSLSLPDSRCPRYLGVEIRGVKNGISPAGVRERLAAFGVRPISLLVDAANWVMLELGQPLHAFDLDTLRGGITVRAANAGETLVSLDGQARALSPWPLKGQPFAPLLICDSGEGARPIALAGVMGGRDTEVSARTANIYLEAASFNPLAIRRAARQFSLHSEASHRFERGVDPLLPARAAARFVQLLRAWGAGGEVAGWRLLENTPHQPRRIELRDAALLRLLGIELEREFVESRLGALGLLCRDRSDMACTWEISAWRPDLVIEEDLIEEAGRHYGYDNIPERLPGGIDPAPGRSANQLNLERLCERARSSGFHEIISVPFIDWQQKKIFAMNRSSAQLAPLVSDATPALIKNPIWLDKPLMRTSVSASLIRALEHNAKPEIWQAEEPELRLFEAGRVYQEVVGHSDTPPSCKEESRIALMIAFHPRAKMNFRDKVYRMQQVAGAMVNRTGLRWSEQSGGGHAGHKIKLTCENNPITLEVNSSANHSPPLSKMVFHYGLIELCPEAITADPVQFHALPEYPEIHRDLNLWMPLGSAIAIEKQIQMPLFENVRVTAQKSGCQYLAHVGNLDMGYVGGEKDPEFHNRYALAVRFTFRNPGGTLTAEAVDSEMATLTAAFAGIGVAVRGV